VIQKKENKMLKNNTLLLIVIFIISLCVGCSEDTIDEEFFGDLIGTVVSADSNEPLTNVKITTSPSTSTVFSDNNGNFTLRNIRIDNYSVMAELDGYDIGFEGVEISEGVESVVAFELALTSTINDPPLAPVLISPEDETNDLEVEVIFEWEPSVSMEDELTYTLVLRNILTNENREFVVVDETTITVSDLELGANYLWQVMVSDGVNAPVSSVFRTFSTLSFPSNPFLFVKKEGPNNVIFSGAGEAGNQETQTDENLFQLTDDGTNSFRPRRNTQVQKIAFLRSVGGETHIFTMDLTGENVEQLTNIVPVAGFRQEELDFSWSPDGSYILYPFFDRLYRVNLDNSGEIEVYTTPDGSLISEVDIQDLDEDVILLKTNNLDGYEARIFTIRLSTQTIQTIILEGVPGAAGGAQISANGNIVLYNRDIDETEVPA